MRYCFNFDALNVFRKESVTLQGLTQRTKETFQTTNTHKDALVLIKVKKEMFKIQAFGTPVDVN